MLTKAQYSPIVPTIWSKEFYEELRPQLGISALISNDYEGEISQLGDKVKVQQLLTPGRAQILTSDNEAYSTQIPTFANIDLEVNKRAIYPVDVTDWAKYQANPKYQDEIRKIIAHEIARALDQAILDEIAPGSSIGGQAAMSKALFAQASRVLSLNNVPNDGRRIALIDEYYLEDLIQVNELLSRDYATTGSAFLTGKLKDPIYGFQIYVTNLLDKENAYFFHPSFMQIAIQQGADYKEIDLEGNTNIVAMRVRGMNLFGLKQFDANRVYRVYNT